TPSSAPTPGSGFLPTRTGHEGVGSRSALIKQFGDKKTSVLDVQRKVMRKRRKLKVGDWVEVRGKEDILRTLDGDGKLDGMPFMPEMFKFCGQRFRVHKRAHKTCDPDNRSRRLEHTVHLETRCDGQAHGGCEAGCLIFWKEAWLKPIGGNTPRNDVV